MATEPETDYWTAGRIGRHWRLAVVCVLVGLGVGAAVGALRPAVYTAEARLAVGTGTLTDLNVPGFPTASAEMAADYARWVNANGIVGLELPPGTIGVQASPFPASNVVRIEATSKREAVALQAADRVAGRLQDEVNAVATANDTDELLTQAQRRAKTAVEAQLAVADAKADLDRARGAGQEAGALRARYLDASAVAARAELVANGLQDRYRRLISTSTTETQLSRVGNGSEITKDSKNSTIARYALIGIGGGVLLALLLIRKVESNTSTWLRRR